MSYKKETELKRNRRREQRKTKEMENKKEKKKIELLVERKREICRGRKGRQNKCRGEPIIELLYHLHETRNTRRSTQKAATAPKAKIIFPVQKKLHLGPRSAGKKQIKSNRHHSRPSSCTSQRTHVPRPLFFFLRCLSISRFLFLVSGKQPSFAHRPLPSRNLQLTMHLVAGRLTAYPALVVQ